VSIAGMVTLVAVGGLLMLMMRRAGEQHSV
jgi:hypothetical protein